MADKVIKDLEQLKHCITKPCDITCSYYNAEDMICPCSYDVLNAVTIDNAIQIIRELQSEEEVCEWIVIDGPDGLSGLNTSCGAIRLSCTEGVDIYCNNCGRKIKVVEDSRNW